ncbi:hypothetical protein K4K55_006548 [Colletotrichum sp. SAR 10_96]|nr:hypothetical protein K4K55_006548 [Colletotrichum sp. SAR 10_96]
MSSEEGKSLNRILETMGLSKVQVTLEKPTPPSMNSALPIDPALSLENGDIITPGVDVASVRAPSHPLLSSYSGEGGGALSDNENDDSASGTTEEDLVNQLSDRLGSLHIGPNGQISYYGPTSNFSLVEMPAGSDTLAVDRTVRNDGQEHLDMMGYGKTIPPDLEEHLINLYFAWQDPFSHIVDRTLYEDAKYKWLEREEDTPYYSEALRNAMCSLGAAFEARYHPNFVTFPKSLPDFFAARAKTLLEIELDSPSVSTVQAMVVLSSHEIGANRDSRGWLYSGMAIRLAFDLALHKDMTPYVTKGILTPAEADLRRAVFWGTYVVDQTLGYYRGRPFRVSLDDITVQKPVAGASGAAAWLPYTSPRSNDTPPAALTYHSEDVSLQRIELCEIMAPLGHTLYGNSKIPRNVLQEKNEQIVSLLFIWKENLPEALQVDLEDTEGTYLPHVLLLHMQYYQNVIHAHRPWMSSSYLQPQPPQGPGYMHAQRMCIESAAAVAKLILLYERRYSLRRVNIQGVAVIFSAAIILIFASMSRRRRRRAKTAETATHLSVCFRALEELSASWECAKRSRDFLLMLQRKWELKSRRLSGAGAAAAAARRPGMGPTSGGGGLVRAASTGNQSRKRARTDSPAGSRSVGSFQSISPSQQPGDPGVVDDRGEVDHEGIDMDMRLDLDWVFAAGGQAMPGTWDGLLPPDALYFNQDGPE